MPIDLGIKAPNIAEGWGPMPQLHAAPIGELVRSILANRLVRDKMMQENIADTIKNIREQRQSDAYAEALRNAGLTQGQDISGLDSAHATRLAQLILQQTPDTQMDEYHKAMTELARARAADINDPDVGSIDPAEQRRQDAERRREENDRLKAAKDQMKLAELPKDAVPHALAPGETVTPGTYPFDVGGKRQDVPQSQVDQFNVARRVYDTLTKQRAGVPPGRNVGGVSSGGTPLASQDEIRRARARQALDDPEATPEEKRQATIILSQ